MIPPNDCALLHVKPINPELVISKLPIKGHFGGIRLRVALDLENIIMAFGLWQASKDLANATINNHSLNSASKNIKYWHTKAHTTHVTVVVMMS